MPFYAYSALDVRNKRIKGRVEAKSRDIAAGILRDRQLFVVSLHEQSDSIMAEFNAVFGKVKADDIVNFTRQLATMINAGLPLLQSFGILEVQAKPAMRKVIRKLVREIESGSNLGDALKKQGNSFDTVYIALVQAGEAAGALDTILRRLADTLEKQKEFRAKAKGALIYPTIVFTAMIGVMSIMMIFVVPQMTSLYKDFGADLPMATQILIDISGFFTNKWYVMIALAAGGFTVFRAWVKTETGRLQYDRFRLRIPILGKLSHQILVTEFSRTMALMVSAGISLLPALEIVTRGLNNRVYQVAIKQARDDVEKGHAMSQALLRASLFPPLLPQMVSVGEETGKLDEVLEKLAQYYESETENAIKGLTAALEPMIMVILGIGVGFLIIAIVMPIYSLTSQF